MDDANTPWWNEPTPPQQDDEPTAPDEPAPSPGRFGPALLAMLLFGGAVLGAAAGHLLWPGTSGAPPAVSAVPTGGSGPADAAAIAQRVDAGVVDITIANDYNNLQAAGTGMLLDSSGLVLTNNHVIGGATQISVTDIANGRTYAAQVLGYDRSHDIGLLRLVGADHLSAVTTSTAPVRVGQAVVAVGNAGGRGGTPSYAGGTVTALNQSITAADPGDGTSEHLTGLIETNADVVSGDSGGPLVDENARVIGIDTAASAGFQFQAGDNQGFAIPIAVALRIVHQIESGVSAGTVHVGPTAFLGVEVNAGGPAGAGSSAGATVAAVIPGGPADAAGLAPGDVITSVASHRVATPDDLTAAMLLERPGSTVRVDYLDPAGSSRTATVRLGSGPPQ